MADDWASMFAERKALPSRVPDPGVAIRHRPASGHRGLPRLEDLPPLQPAQAVRDAEERAALAKPDPEPAARRDLHGAERRQPDGAEGAHARRHRTQRLGQEHAAQAGRGHHQAVERHGQRRRAHLGADRARGRLPPGDLGPRERLHQRDHARPDEAGDHRARSTRSSSSPR